MRNEDDALIRRLESRLQDARWDLEDAEAEIKRLEARLRELEPEPTIMARYAVMVTVGDGSTRAMTSEECPLEVARREVHELKATGYSAWVIE